MCAPGRCVAVRQLERWQQGDLANQCAALQVYHVFKFEEIGIEFRDVLVVAWEGRGRTSGLIVIRAFECWASACSIGEGEGNALAAHDLVHRL